MSETASTPRFTNRLSSEKSPYLLQHAHNPVDWYPWGQEALDTARAQDKPIFLSVGYSACHWCHVMERESFENEAIADRLNDNFVCIKVDREERPDIDEIYMTAVQMLTGHGGWPMSVFLTPDGRPFYGGTYFPPQSVRGRIGFPSLVTQLGEAWRNRRDEVERIASEIADDVEKATRQRPIIPDGDSLDSSSLLSKAVEDLTERFDADNGGFGGVPKFPPHHALRLLTAAARRGDAKAPHLLITTLDRMALGGIYDHIGGGFHRYATDSIWLLPHFEKMLYDNALLARVYADASQLTGRKAYARIARETCDWVLRDTMDASGGFQAALDADSEGEEGKFYVWTPGEVANVLGEAEASAFAMRYHIKTGGNFRDEATGHQSASSIPYLAVGASEVDLPDELTPELAVSRHRLRTARAERVPPGKDDKVITAWNGLMIGALAFVGATLDEVHYVDAARRAARFALTTLRPGGQLVRRYAKGEAGVPAFLDDYAYLADGLMDLYDATKENEWRDAASSLTDILISAFWDAEDGGFFYTRSDHENLIARSKDLFDGALPSANGVAARVLARLGALKIPNSGNYTDTVRTLLTAYRGVLERAPGGTHTLIGVALDTFTASDVPTLPHAPVLLETVDTAVILTPGETGAAAFLLRIGEGYHIEARSKIVAQEQTPIRNKTVATISTNAPAAIGPVVFPTATPYPSGDETIPAYTGNVEFTVPVQTTADAEPGTYQVSLTLRCEPCSESECLPPVELTATVTVSIR